MTITQTKPQFLTEALIEVLNNEWKVNALESNRSHYHQLEMEIGRKYIKVWQRLNRNGVKDTSRNMVVDFYNCWMFVDKNTGECYKPASYKAPAKGVRYLITQLADNPHICDPYGSFLYL